MKLHTAVFLSVAVSRDDRRQWDAGQATLGEPDDLWRSPEQLPCYLAYIGSCSAAMRQDKAGHDSRSSLQASAQ